MCLFDEKTKPMVTNDKSKTIFLIDDDRVTTFVNKRIMEKSGVQVKIHTFNNAVDALYALKQLTVNDFSSLPDVILLDVNMPVMDGWEFLEEYSKLVPSAGSKIYMLSASLNEQDVTASERYHSVCGFLNKPLKAEQLYEILEAMVLAA